MTVVPTQQPIDADLAARLAARHFGLTTTAHELPGERERNFLLEAGAAGRFVLKLAPPDEPLATLDLQQRALAHVAGRVPGVALPRPLRSRDDRDLVPTEHGLLRVLSWVPGRPLALARPHDTRLLESIGHAVGALDAALTDFAHPAAARALKWDLARPLWARAFARHVADAERRAQVERLLTLFEREVLPRLPALRAQVIYNDANDYNVLVDVRDPARREIVGLIDFGDLLHAPLVCDVAIAMAYAMLGKPDPLAAGAAVVAGFHAACALAEDELELLFTLVRTRLAVSVINAAHARVAEPDNAYLQVTEQPAWELLGRLARVEPALACATWRAACGLPATRNTRPLAAWLARHGAACGALLEPDPRRVRCQVLDLSVGSPELDDPRLWREPRAWSERLFARLREAEAVVGIGRYDDARPFYATPGFEAVGNDGPEPRTVHLGLDLFVAPGTPVLAPLDGRVYGAALNARPLDYGPTIVLEHVVDEGRLTFYTLYGHLDAASVDALAPGQPIARGTCLGRVGDHDVNGGWPPHLHFQVIADMLGQRSDFPGVARPSQRALWLELCPDPGAIAGTAAAPSSTLDAPTILGLRQAHVGPSLSVSYRQPLHIVRGYMQQLFDVTGRGYLDCVNNVAHVGHCHPRVVHAAQQQLAVLNTNTRYLHAHLARYAERLCATLPEPLRVCYLVCSGSEANELALRLARTYTRSRETLVLEVGYHGNTSTLVDVSSYKHDGPGGTGAPNWVHTLPTPDVYRGAYRTGTATPGAAYAQHVRAAVERITAAGQRVGAFLAESILSCAGQIVLPDGFLRAAYEAVRAAGGVCIADEVQVGFGRVGSHFWAFETQGVVPDIVTLGKPIGNGHPLGAVITTPAIAAAFANGMEYFNTFGGNPVSCATGLAVLDVLADERLQARAGHVGARLQAGLRQLATRHALIGDVRGLGLFQGIELVSDRTTLAPAADQAAYVVERLRERGLLVSTDGPLHNVLKLKPPLVFGEADADRLVSELDLVLGEDAAQP